MGRTEIARFQTMITVRQWGQEARLRVHHTGRLRRGNPGVTVEHGSGEAVGLAAALMSDAEFVAAVSSLDFTRFDLELEGDSCVTTVELMGATFVSIAFPPIRSYIRLHGDQRDALIASLVALERVVG